MFRYQRENEVENLREFGLNVASDIVCELVETFCSARILDMKFGK
jgi:hypothetical protein